MLNADMPLSDNLRIMFYIVIWWLGLVKFFSRVNVGISMEYTAVF